MVCTPTPTLKVALGEPPTANHALTAVMSPLDAAVATRSVRSMFRGRSTWAMLGVRSATEARIRPGRLERDVIDRSRPSKPSNARSKK